MGHVSSTPAPSEVELARAAAARLRDDVADDLADRLRTADWHAGSVEESGQFHRVLVLPGVAVLRMARAAEAGAAPGAGWAPEDSPAALLPRRAALVTALADADLPFAIPTPLSEVVTAHDGAGRAVSASVLQAFVPGQPHPPHEGDPAALRAIVAALEAVDVTTPGIAASLAPPFAFRGPWDPERVARVAALPDLLSPEHAATLPEGWADVVVGVTDRVRAWAAAPPDGPSLVHGDLAGHNMLWTPVPAGESSAPETGPKPADVRWELSGVLDWDLAHAGDAARNVAYLGIWHGEELIDAVARTPAEAVRARVWLAAAALDSLDDARARQELTGRAPRWGRLLRKVLPRVVRGAAAL